MGETSRPTQEKVENMLPQREERERERGRLGYMGRVGERGWYGEGEKSSDNVREKQAGGKQVWSKSRKV